MKNNSGAWLSILVIPVIVVVVVASIVLDRRNSQLAHLDILVAPASSMIKVDGRAVKAGTYNVKAGSHVVAVSRAGFTNQTKSLSVNAKQTQFVGIILQSNSDSTKNWYQNHPSDNNLAQSINNRSFDQAGENALTNNPLLAKLPYLGPGLHFRVDFGVPSADSKTNYPSIYIRYDSDAAKSAALTWIKNQGSDPNSMDIVYMSVPLNSLQQ